MEYKKHHKKIDFFKTTEEKQARILKKALSKGQQQQKVLEKKYEQLFIQKSNC